jgi:hypothetical protein
VSAWRAAALAVALALSLAPAGAYGASPHAAAGPAACRLGAFVTSLHSIDTGGGTFGMDMWVWSVCPDPRREPLKTMELFTANAADRSLYSVTPRPQGAWSQVKVAGTFREHYDLRNYPFDRHQLVISLEEGVEDATQFVYAPDRANSRIDPSVRIEGWRVMGFAVRPRIVVYPTTFGDPSLPAGAKAPYTRLDLIIDIARDQVTSFLKLTIPLYAAAALALVSFLMHTEKDARLNPRIAFLGGAMLTVVINMRSIDEAVGQAEGVSLLDLLHSAVLLLIVAATVEAIVCTAWLERRVAVAKVRRLDYVCFWTGGALYLLANVAAVLSAIVSG